MRRFALLAAVIVIAVVAFIALKPGDDEKKTSSQPAQTSGPKPAKPAKPQFVQIRVQNGKPAGGVKDITVSKGDEIRFTVSSDVSDEIHVHGYDFMKDVKAGGKVSFDFPAKIDGEFEVELESRGEQIAQLTVNP